MKDCPLMLIISDWWMNFYNGRNPSIVNTLQNEAYEDDANHRVAYYVVKNNSGEILFYFSLKCGLLYDEFLEGDRLLDMKENWR